MKTFLSETAKSIRIAPNSIAYKIVKDVMSGTNKTGRITWRDNVAIIRPCYTLGSGKWVSNQDHTFAVKHLLSAVGIAYTWGNDSKFGGKTGNWVKVVL